MYVNCRHGTLPAEDVQILQRFCGLHGEIDRVELAGRQALAALGARAPGRVYHAVETAREVGAQAEVPWVPGQWHGLKKVKLQDIAVRGNPGDFVLLVGGTW